DDLVTGVQTCALPISGEVIGLEPGLRAEFGIPECSTAGDGSRTLVLREHTSRSARNAIGARGHRQAGPELLHSLPRAAKDHRIQIGRASCRERVSDSR